MPIIKRKLLLNTVLQKNLPLSDCDWLSLSESQEFWHLPLISEGKGSALCNLLGACKKYIYLTFDYIQMCYENHNSAMLCRFESI